MASEGVDWNRYSNEAYSISFPSDWSLQERDGGIVQLVAAGDDDLAITIQSFVSPDAELTSAVLTTLLDDFRGVRQLVEPPRWLQSDAWIGLEAALFAGEADHPRTRWVFRAVCVGARAVVLHLNGDVDCVAALRNTWELVMSSIRLESR